MRLDSPDRDQAHHDRLTRILPDLAMLATLASVLLFGLTFELDGVPWWACLVPLPAFCLLVYLYFLAPLLPLLARHWFWRLRLKK